MPSRSTSNAARNARRQQVADLHLKGFSQFQIAATLKVNQSTVSRDLRELRDQWSAEAERDRGIAAAAELQRLNQIEKAAWAGWTKSLESQRSVQITKNSKAEESTRTGMVERHGNSSLLRVIDHCSARRMDLWKLVPRRPGWPRPGSESLDTDTHINTALNLFDKAMARKREVEQRALLAKELSRGAPEGQAPGGTTGTANSQEAEPA